jgi:ketosteroid isomerase-like protein
VTQNVLIAACTAATALLQQPASALQESADTIELSRLERAWNEAHVRGDAEALDRLWADDFVVTVPGMPVMTKPDTIGVWRTGRMKFQRYETSDVRMRVYDNAAIVTGRVQRTRTVGGNVADDDWLFTKMYVRRAGGWQVVAFHASPAPRR